jgi:CRISPR-associated protein Csb2
MNLRRSEVMSLTIAIRFLTGRAHLHPWQTHHSEGRVDWPPAPWRFLRAIVAVAGRGLTTLPLPDYIVDPGRKPRPTKRNPHPVWPSSGYVALPDEWSQPETDEVPVSRLASLLRELSSPPHIWLPKTSGGHTRQYFPLGSPDPKQWIEKSGSAVFDTFAVIRKDHPLFFHWPDVALDSRIPADLTLILARLTYFGRGESWCQARVHADAAPEQIPGITIHGRYQTHWPCICVEDDPKFAGQEYRDYSLERRLSALPLAGDGTETLPSQAVQLLPRTKRIATGSRPRAEEDFRTILRGERPELVLLRCLLRESGQDIKDGLERPIGTRWVHYAVPRAVYDLSRPVPFSPKRQEESVNLVRYALNTATVHRPVLPLLTDVLLVADRFRSAVMALARHPGRAVSGHEANGAVCREHDHAFWWPTDEDNDGFLDHVTVYARAGFEQDEVDALRRLTRIRQRGGRPDLLVTPIFVGRDHEFKPWRLRANVFISATPYYCAVSLSRGRSSRASRPHSIKKEIRKRLRQQQLIDRDDDVEIHEFVFDYAPSELDAVQLAIANGEIHPPIPPRQYFPVIDPPTLYPELPRPVSAGLLNDRYEGSTQKDPDEPFTFGLCSGMNVGGGRFLRSLAFCRRRRNHEVRGPGRMFCLVFRNERSRKPFAVGDQCHFGFGLFVPGDRKEVAIS